MAFLKKDEFAADTTSRNQTRVTNESVEVKFLLPKEEASDVTASGKQTTTGFKRSGRSNEFDRGVDNVGTGKDKLHSTALDDSSYMITCMVASEKT